MHLLTWHGSLVCLPDQTGVLRHHALPLAPEAPPPLDLDIASSGGQASIRHAELGVLHVQGGSRRHAVFLLRDGKFLCAEPESGLMSFDREHGAAWETFLPLAPQDVRDLTHILGARWILRETRRLIRRSAVALAEDFVLRIGGFEISLAPGLGGLVKARDADGLPQNLVLPLDGAELVIAEPRGSALLDTALWPVRARRVAEILTLAVHRQLLGSEPTQEVFERDTGFLQARQGAAGLEDLLEAIAPAPHADEPIAEGAARLARVRDALLDFDRGEPGRQAGGGSLSDITTPAQANRILQRFLREAGLAEVFRFDSYDRAQAGHVAHAGICRVEILNNFAILRLPSDPPPPLLMIQRCLALINQLDMMFAAGPVPDSVFLAEPGDGAHEDSVAFCSNAAGSCLIPDPDFLASNGYADMRRTVRLHQIAWSERKPAVFWRGSTTGDRRKPAPAEGTTDDFSWLPRLDLCRRARDSELAAYYDVGVANVVQISEPHLLARIEASGFLKPPAPREAFLGCKGVIVIDGNSNAWSALFCALLTGACVLLVESPKKFRQWYYDRLVPWVHFVPVSTSMDDLDARVAWLIEHDSEAQAIGEAGRGVAEAMTVETELAQAAAKLRSWLLETNPITSSAVIATRPVERSPVDDVLMGWALRELAPWQKKPVSRAYAEQAFDDLNASHRWMAVFEFDEGDVQIRAKPEQLGLPPLQDDRAHYYLEFFRSVAPMLPSGFRASLCMGLADALPSPYDVPVFCFQKHAGWNNVLLPDIDFLTHDFYARDALQDKLVYADKDSAAIFAGGTSGGLITPEVARNLSLPRLRAAKFFENSERVDFRLPGIGQCTTPEAEALLRAQTFCQRPTLTWPEQYRYRMLISMDGNGATCSRVALALHSNSVLLKYDSVHILYYFGGLQPWVHYVPIEEDADVERILDLESRDPQRFARIAANGRSFAQTYLGADAARRYTAMLLQIYAGSFTESEAPVAVTRHKRNYAPLAVTETSYMLAHIQNRGDQRSALGGWIGEPGSTLAIEGFAISLGAGLPAKGFSYQAVLANGVLSEVARNGEYRGTRGENLPTYGICITTDSQFAGFDLEYEATFIDGTRIGPVPAGTLCKAPSGKQMEALRVTILQS